MSKIIPFEKSFASHKKAKYWSDKNLLKPNEVMKGTHKKYIFNCDCGHEFEANLYNIIKGSWCSYCAKPARNLCDKEDCNQCFEKSFASHEKAVYWSNKNKLKPREVFKSTKDKYWFNCNCGHEFEAGLDNVVNNCWCPYCSNNKLCDKKDCNLCFEKSFASHEKSTYWSDTNELKPNQVFRNSNKNYLFICNICNHKISKRISDINKDNGWCPYCSNPPKQLCTEDKCIECYEKSFASHEKAVYWSNKNKLIPKQVFKNSNNKYIFNCNLCNHEIILRLCDIIKGHWCSYCSNQLLCSNDDCKSCYEKSFASHEKFKYWSLDNNELPIQVFKYTNKPYIFNCNDCNHKFSAILNNITSKNQWCPYCAKPCKKLCDNNDCMWCFNNSFASHIKSNEFSIKNNINPRQIFKGSNDKYLFDCKICNHEYETIIGNNCWCGYCSSKKLCDNNECEFCFEKSFISHSKSKYLIDKTINARLLFKGTQKKFMFKCNKSHIFNTSLNKITGSNRWCPYCVNKTEQIVFDKLQPIYNNLQQQYKVDWCKNITYLPFDFVLEEQKIIIELDGRQHFEQVRNWDNPDKTQERDKYKMKQANNNGYSVIRLLQEDVYYDTYQWLEELKINIEKIITESKVQNIFMCQDDEYKIFEVLE
jgi:very-short-patch-repair endonuclease